MAISIEAVRVGPGDLLVLAGDHGLGPALDGGASSGGRPMIPAMIRAAAGRPGPGPGRPRPSRRPRPGSPAPVAHLVLHPLDHPGAEVRASGSGRPCAPAGPLTSSMWRISSSWSGPGPPARRCPSSENSSRCATRGQVGVAQHRQYPAWPSMSCQWTGSSRRSRAKVSWTS